jgi:CBS domain-containing protein
MIVMSTHGQTGVLRFLMGSVAEYTVRNATCPVVTCRNPKIEPSAAESSRQHQEYVTDVMHHVRPIRGFDELPKVIGELDRAKETGAPVVDDLGNCVGILTKTDIQKYRDLKTRFENQDPTVIDMVFETDKYGQRRAGNFDFDQVHRHMTAPVVTISNAESCQKARELFDQNPDIHHLVVVNESNCPVGILQTEDVAACGSMSTGS